MAALIEDDRGGVIGIGVAIDDIAVVACLTGLDNTVPASPDINAHRLVGSADLPGWAIQGERKASIGQQFARPL
ncbi:MAG TPA: hypothetical protein VHT91_22480 [Kofleriaceae bacterium]|nr:hypothetical protein [Kofleriaceae bacterium]